MSREQRQGPHTVSVGLTFEGDFQGVQEIMEAQQLRSDLHFQSLLKETPLPSPNILVDALMRIDFTKQRSILASHPGAELFIKMDNYKRSFKMLISFYEDLTAANGRFQGLARAGAHNDEFQWEATAFNFTKGVFAFSAAAKACDAMMNKLGRPPAGRGAAMVSKAREIAYNDLELIEFVHELRNHLSHNVLEEPDTSIHWEGKDEPAITKVMVAASRFDGTRGAKAARAFLKRNAEIDLMEVATRYVAMASKAKGELEKDFWGGLTDLERNYGAVKSTLSKKLENSSYGIYLQILSGNRNLDPLRFLHQKLNQQDLEIIRGFPDRSDEQFEALDKILDPFGFVNQDTKDKLRIIYSDSARHSDNNTP